MMPVSGQRDILPLPEGRGDRVRGAPGRPSRRALPAMLARFLGCAAGVSAVEFALLAPVLVVGAFSTADVGMAIYERMMIGQSLRAASQLAMTGADENEVLAVLQEVATQNFGIAQDGQQPALSYGVESYCVCPGETFLQVDCTAICDSGLGALQFYRLSLSKTFEGVLLPDFGLAGSVSVLKE